MLKSLKALAFLTAILAVLAAIWFAVFAGSGFLNIDTEKIDESYPVGEGTTLYVESSFGKIDISTYNGTQIKLVGEKNTNFGDSELDRIDLNVETGKYFLIDIDNNDYWWVWFSLDIRIPDYVKIKEVNLINGELEIEGTSGSLDIDIRNGDMSVRKHNGNVYADCEDGNVEIIDLDGNLTVDQKSGELDVIGVSGVVDVELNSGEMKMKDINTLRSVSVDSGSLDIQFDNIHRDGGEINSDFGEVRVRIPMNLSCRLDIKADMGDIIIENLAVDWVRNEEMEKVGTIGDGGPILRIRLGFGEITLEGI